MSESKKRLLELEKTGNFLFHGSPNEVKIFEPRQSHNDIHGVLVEDGDPAIAASPAIDYAIFMAIFNKKNLPKGHTSRVTVNADDIGANIFELEFSSSKEGLEQLNENASGWVYVFKKEEFPFKKGPAEYRSDKPVSYIEKIFVTSQDLPENIQVLESW